VSSLGGWNPPVLLARTPCANFSLSESSADLAPDYLAEPTTLSLNNVQ